MYIHFFPLTDFSRNYMYMSLLHFHILICLNLGRDLLFFNFNYANFYVCIYYEHHLVTLYNYKCNRFLICIVLNQTFHNKKQIIAANFESKNGYRRWIWWKEIQCNILYCFLLPLSVRFHTIFESLISSLFPNSLFKSHILLYDFQNKQ